jgi:hypothetical protein
MGTQGLTSAQSADNDIVSWQGPYHGLNIHGQVRGDGTQTGIPDFQAFRVARQRSDGVSLIKSLDDDMAARRTRSAEYEDLVRCSHGAAAD